MSDSDSGDAQRRAVVLDYLPHGRTDDDRPQYERSAVGYAAGESDFTLYEMAFSDESDASIGDRIVVEPAADREGIEHIREIEYDDLSGGAQSELEYVVEEIVERDEGRFVDVYTEAQPITTRLHSLNLLPGIGEKLRNGILDERRRKPFEDFEDLEERVDGLHDPKTVIADRILEEIKEEDLKYRLFARREEEAQ